MYRWLVGLPLIGLLAGCQAPPATVIPTPEILQVQVSSSVEWLRPMMAECTGEGTNLAITVDSLPSSIQSLDAADILIQWTEVQPSQGTSFAVGMDELVVIVNPQNPVEEMDSKEVAEIFAGTLADWEELDGASGKPQPWVYPSSDDAMVLFADRMVPFTEIDQTSMLAPTASAMITAVSRDTLAIGLLPSRWLDSSVKQVRLADIPPESWQVPILAVLAGEPEGSARDWLLCLQDSILP